METSCHVLDYPMPRYIITVIYDGMFRAKIFEKPKSWCSASVVESLKFNSDGQALAAGQFIVEAMNKEQHE